MKVTIVCPKCGSLIKVDFNDDYISNPEIGMVDDYNVYCGDCHRDIIIPFKVIKSEVTIEFATTKMR